MFPTREQEIEDFKRHINLTEYAVAQGYVLDRKESSRNSATLRGPGDDKIIIGKDAASGHWIYFSVRDNADHGTIVDFVQNRQRLTLGELRKTLRPWLGENPHPPRGNPVFLHRRRDEPHAAPVAGIRFPETLSRRVHPAGYQQRCGR